MPFTLSHVAANLPFLHRSTAVGWAPALVFGSVIPDLLFPIPYFGARSHTHTVLGLIALDIPFAMLLAVFWVFMAAKRASRLPGLSTLGRANPADFSFPMTFLGAFIGCGIHLIWDLFTHQGSPLLRHAFLTQPIFEGNRGQLTWITAIWYTNSLLGVGVLAWWARRRLHARGDGLRRVFLAGPWLRIYAAFLLPYLFVLAMVLRTRPDSIGQVMIDLTYLLHVVRGAMIVSVLSVLAVAWWETRSPRDAQAAPA
jgi:hypothetical protein